MSPCQTDQQVVVLEWMIAIVALCGAIAGFAALYLVLRFFAMHVARDRDPSARHGRVMRRWRRRRDSQRDADRDWTRHMARLDELLPRARVYRCRQPAARRR